MRAGIYARRARRRAAARMKVWAALAPRSVDTLSTIARKQAALLHCDNRSDFKPRLYPCCNMQKDLAGGVSGVMTEVDAGDTLLGLDGVTENLFGGVSVVRCHASGAQAAAVVLDKERLLGRIGAALHGAAPLPVQQLLPGGAQDFFWHEQVCEGKGGTALRNAILQDGRRQDVNFYDAYACAGRRTSAPGDAECDACLRDGAPWAPVLSGSVGLYEEQAGGGGVYLVCCSSMPSVGSEVRARALLPRVPRARSARLTRSPGAEQLVRALKADLLHTVTARDFCESKEMWFLRSINRRNRLRVILETAACLGLAIPTAADICAHPDDPRQRLAVECCGVSTEFFDSAAVLERNENQTLPLLAFAGDTRRIEVVRHFKGCVDLAQHAGAIPVVVSEAQGVVLLTTDALFRPGAGLDSDAAGIAEAPGAAGTHCLFPVANVTEDRASHAATIQQEMQLHPHFSLHDIVHHSIFAQTVLARDVAGLASARDACGLNLFYGVQYEAPIPTVVYPHTALRFLPAGPPAAAAAAMAPAPPEPDAEPAAAPRQRARTLPECMCAPVTVAPRAALLHFSPAEQARDAPVAMAWDEVSLHTVRMMALGGGAGLRAHHLAPLLVHSARA